MKTPAQWIKEQEACYGSGPLLHVSVIVAIQRDAIAHEYARFTEATLKEAGWYFFYPADTTRKPIFTECIPHGKDDWRTLRFYAGTYIGPVDPPKL